MQVNQEAFGPRFPLRRYMKEALAELNEILNYALVAETREQDIYDKEEYDDRGEAENSLGYWSGVICATRKAIQLITDSYPNRFK